MLKFTTKTNVLLVFAYILLTLTTIANAQDRPTLTEEQLARVQIQAVPGKEGLFVIPGFDGGLSGGNVAVRVTDNGVVLVDNKFPYSHDDIMTQVRKVSEAPIRYVLNTHHHSDHAGSNTDFMPEAQVIGHENVRANMLRNNQAGAPPVIYSHSTSVFMDDAEIQAHYYGRGHTSGDSVILFAELRTVHTGDLFIWGQRLDGSTLAPFIDFANGGSAAEWTDTLDQVLQLDFDTVIPGHGPILSKAEIRVFRDKFSILVERIEALIERGVGRDSVVGELSIDDLNWPLSAPALQAIYDELLDTN
jgi:glyoxylase-like metal-dependent hydrolase (beta-lactamase superfamily II)